MYEWWRRRKTGWHRPSPEYHGDCDGCSKNYRTGDDPVKRRYRTHVTSRSRKYRNLRAIASRNWQRVADRAKLLPALFALLSLLFSTAVPVFIPLGSGCHPQTSPKPRNPRGIVALQCVVPRRSLVIHGYREALTRNLFSVWDAHTVSLHSNSPEFLRVFFLFSIPMADGPITT